MQGEFLSRRRSCKSQPHSEVHIRSSQSCFNCFKRAVRLVSQLTSDWNNLGQFVRYTDKLPQQGYIHLLRSGGISWPCVPACIVHSSICNASVSTCIPHRQWRNLQKAWHFPSQRLTDLSQQRQTTLHSQHVRQNNPHSCRRLLAALLHSCTNVSEAGSMSYSWMHHSTRPAGNPFSLSFRKKS